MNLGQQTVYQMQRLWNIFAPELLRCRTFEDQIVLLANDKLIGDSYRKYHQLLYYQCVQSEKFFKDIQEDRHIRWLRCSLGVLPGDDFDQQPDMMTQVPAA
ncbi:MAG: hypothetical protein MN733_23005 [Nitrososphaera sp.]|nr:hypothetical protein [Nitrososphaera sp.]